MILCSASIGAGAASAATKFVVSSPTTKVALPGKVTVSAKLNARRSAGIVSAKFYVNGKKVTTDNRYPFKVKRGVKFDTRNLPTAHPTVRLSVVFKIRKSSGKLVKRTLRRNVRVKVFVDPNPSVGSKAVPSSPPNPPVPTAYGYPLALNDDFNGSSIDTGKWNRQRYDTLDGWSAQNPPLTHPFNGLEGAAYGIPNVTVANGALSLKLQDTKATGSAAEYTRSTGMVNSRGKFQFKYGYVETRAWVSDCIACWPTFWILPSDDTWPPEVDIFEYINPQGAQKRYPYATPHWKPDNVTIGDDHPDHHADAKQEYFNTTPAGTTGDFMGEGEWHTYGMLWTPDSLKFFFDGVLGSQVDGATKIPQQPMYAIYQMAIGNSSFGVPPAGSSLNVDYLRIYSSNT